MERQCLALGADMIYIESSSEFTWLLSNNIISSTNPVLFNVHQLLYGTPNVPSFYWSNGQPLINGQFGLNWTNGEPNTCTYLGTVFLQTIIWVPGYGLSSNAVNAYTVDAGNTGALWGVSGCKRQLCGIQSLY